MFPGDANGKPVQEIKRFWHDVRKQAKITDVRIHDLRHTFASLLVSGGMSLPMIGKLLGHTQVQTTQRYAHLFDDPLRVGLQPGRRNAPSWNSSSSPAAQKRCRRRAILPTRLQLRQKAANRPLRDTLKRVS